MSAIAIPTTTAAAGGAMVLIADSTLGSDTATFDFTSVPGTYKHLRILLSGRMTGAVNDDVVIMTFNGDSGTNYDWNYDGGQGTATLTSGLTGTTSARVGELPGANSTTGYIGSIEITIPDYASATLFQGWYSIGGRISATGRFVTNNGGQWRSAAAVTRVTLTPGTGSFKTGSRATLYGLN